VTVAKKFANAVLSFAKSQKEPTGQVEKYSEIPSC
jgi:hypothetical protein